VETEPSRNTGIQSQSPGNTPAAEEKDKSTRIEKDTLGTLEVPAEAYYGAQTARAIVNFPISGLKPHPALVWATLIIKSSAAAANMTTGRLCRETGEAVVRAADEALSGALDDQFVIDPFQAGAGTSHNMNVNEVLANRAEEFLGGVRGEYTKVNPNDHVNMAQSTNDVFPTAMRLSSLRMMNLLLPELEGLRDSLRLKGVEFDGILKSGRTHLQDAVPIRLGQEFEAYAAAVEKNIAGILRCRDNLLELGIGGTAVGTGLNAEARYIELVVEAIRGKTGFPVRTAANLIETTQNMDPFVALSSALKGLAVNLTRIANDLRLLSSGPMTGLNEINLPPVQPGSSIMPGKVNPVIPEMVTMVSFQVLGADTTVTFAAQAGQMELNVMMPVIIYNILFSMEILKNAVRKLRESCIVGITANVSRCSGYLESSVGMATVLAPHIGYAAAAEIVKESLRTGRSTKEIILSRKFLSPEALAEIIDPYPLTTPGVSGKRDTKPKEDV
jgi:aspartate ammonia-lyase